MFTDLARQHFRDYFQPSRVVIGVLEADNRSGWNLITLCFFMYCSYKPNMVAFAINRESYSYELVRRASECVLAVPGERIAAETLYCGVASGRQTDKVADCNFGLIESSEVKTPGIFQAKANIEVMLRGKMETGDHITVFGEVKRFNVNTANRERNLLSVGANVDGFDVLVTKGVHRLAVEKRFS